MHDPNQATETQKLLKHDNGFRTFLRSRPTTASSNINQMISASVIKNPERLDNIS